MMYFLLCITTNNDACCICLSPNSKDEVTQTVIVYVIMISRDCNYIQNADN